MIQQGEIYWIDFQPPSGSGPGYRHPHVVVQNDLFNSSRIGTVMVCAITSNLKRGLSPGNVVLRKGEANLPRPGVVDVTRIFAVERADLVEKIGTLSPKRVGEIVAGIKLVVQPRQV